MYVKLKQVKDFAQVLNGTTQVLVSEMAWLLSEPIKPRMKITDAHGFQVRVRYYCDYPVYILPYVVKVTPPIFYVKE